MIAKLQQFFDKYLVENTEKTVPLEHRLQLACAALMVEMVHVDDQFTDDEKTQLTALLDNRFDLSAEELTSLIDLAHDKRHEATDYHEFTSLINKHYSQQQKINLIEDLWQLAYADQQLDKFEEHLLRRLADLLHVPHQDFIKTKHKASKTIS